MPSVDWRTLRSLISPRAGGLVEDRGRYLDMGFAPEGLTESECRHERWVGIITLAFMLLSTLKKTYPSFIDHSGALSRLARNVYQNDLLHCNIPHTSGIMVPSRIKEFIWLVQGLLAC